MATSYIPYVPKKSKVVLFLTDGRIISRVVNRGIDALIERDKKRKTITVYLGFIKPNTYKEQFQVKEYEFYTL